MQFSDLQKILFIDIETVPVTEHFEELTEELQHCWDNKYTLLQKRQPEKFEEKLSLSDAFDHNAGIYAEFGKIVCVSVGYLFVKENQVHFKTKSFCSTNEKEILLGFSNLIVKLCTSKEHYLCGHNIKEFDIPYLCRRMTINKLSLPSILQLNSKKPWETQLLDTMEWWKFGDYKSYTPLKLLTAVLGVPTPKDDIDGSEVSKVFYKENDLLRIATYCQKDVVATAQVFLRLNGFDTIPAQNIEYLGCSEN